MPNDLRLDTPIRLADILRAQGVTVTEPALKRLRRQIAAKERQLGYRLIQRPAPNLPYQTSLTQLRAYMPELFPPEGRGPATQLLGTLETDVDTLSARLAELEETVELLRSELADRRERDDEILSLLESVRH